MTRQSDWVDVMPTIEVYVDKMPESCTECPCCNCNDYNVESIYSCNELNTFIDEADAGKKRLKDCPLKLVPWNKILRGD